MTAPESPVTLGNDAVLREWAETLDQGEGDWSVSAAVEKLRSLCEAVAAAERDRCAAEAATRLGHWRKNAATRLGHWRKNYEDNRDAGCEFPLYNMGCRAEAATILDRIRSLRGLPEIGRPR